MICSDRAIGAVRSSRYRNGKSYILIPQNAALILGSVEKRWPLQARTQSKTHPKKMRCARLGSGSLPLAEMKRFELLRRFEADLPHFECVRNFRTWRNLTEAEGSCGNPKTRRNPEKIAPKIHTLAVRILGVFWRDSLLVRRGGRSYWQQSFCSG